MLDAYHISLLTVMGISVTFALSLNLITGFCGQISLGHAAFLGIGAYGAALLSKAGLPVPLGLAAGALLAGAIGAVVGLTSLRVRHDFLAITTMGVGFLFLGIVRQQDALGGEMGVSGFPGTGLDKEGFMVLVLAVAAATAAFSLYLKKSWLGFAFDAVAGAEDTARLLGVDVDALCSPSPCEDGEAFRADRNVCVQCGLLCGEEGETGRVWPFTQAFSDDCVCETTGDPNACAEPGQSA